ncbi:Uncharacterized protein FWK35_00004356 [Aphis craccivora]|uniref:Uncharacterized protein n=1 Tax=Aphis craccivora TaxID=307492 RepID=A0A6G0ZI92_APHCR|nr:Uncharacterized protein FWK35_00004356 [Aphis craccivora]
MSGLSHNNLPISGVFSLDAVTMLNTPLGMPASSANFAKANAVIGVFSAGFMTHVHPAAKAAPAFLVIIAIGKFHGVIRPTGPSG